MHYNVSSNILVYTVAFEHGVFYLQNPFACIANCSLQVTYIRQ